MRAPAVRSEVERGEVVAQRFEGCYTALITPMLGERGEDVDYEGLHKLVDFQVAGGVKGVLAMGTTGESPTLDWTDHAQVILKTRDFAADGCTVIAGTGSNSTEEALANTRHVVERGISAILLVEPYYNGPSSIEIRREYMAPIARQFPRVGVIPYVIPGRTGTQLLPQDLALLSAECPNVSSVKEASANPDNMRLTRRLCGADFAILSGDDGMTFQMMTDPQIASCGTISVASNVAPAAVSRMTQALLDGNVAESRRLAQALAPLFDIVTVKTQEDSPYGARACKARNPLPVKTLMRLLGMPSGPARRPLGRMTPAGLEVVIAAARKVWKTAPEVLTPVGEFFGVDVEERLTDPACRAGLAYED
jgi:4-hydroxy-tetrahydrodipicolinate synthase